MFLTENQLEMLVKAQRPIDLLEADLRTACALISRGLMECTKDHVKLTATGRAAARDVERFYHLPRYHAVRGELVPQKQRRQRWN